jgi:hypothetical protein
MLPVNTPFFRFAISKAALVKAFGANALEKKSELEEGLADYEKEVMSEVETAALRVSVFEIMLHLIVAGNACMYMPLEGGIKVYHLDSYVVVRDPMGAVLELITEEQVSPLALEASLRDMVLTQLKDKGKEAEKTVRLHTCIKREDGKFKTWQEVEGIRVPDTDGTYPLTKSPFIPLRWNKIDGQDYGRGHVELLQGNLQSAEGLTQSIVEGSAASAKMLLLVNPNGVTKPKTIAEAPNGAIRTGNAADVTVVQGQKSADLQVAQATLERIEGKLEAAFLMHASVQRNGERVTAEEIRFMASELEATLGGVYSVLAQEFQLPLVTRLIEQMVKAKRLNPLPKIVKPTIVTGLEALSRGHDLQKLDVFVSGLAQNFGPEALAKYVNVSDYLTRRATALGLDQKGLVRSADEVAQADQAMQQQAMMAQGIQAAIPNATKAIGDMAKEGVQPPTQPQE